MKNLRLIFLVVTLVTTTSLFAKESKLTLTTKSYQEVYETNKEGEKKIKYITVNKVVPGDIIMYKNNINNQDTKPANNMVLQNPIPEHTKYIANSAKCENQCKVLYSVDGGKTYDIASKLMIKDGDQKRLALPSDYTNVKWILTEPLSANSSTYVSFKTKLQ